MVAPARNPRRSTPLPDFSELNNLLIAMKDSPHPLKLKFFWWKKAGSALRP
jgi:hypothetical protein